MPGIIRLIYKEITELVLLQFCKSIHFCEKYRVVKEQRGSKGKGPALEAGPSL